MEHYGLVNYITITKIFRFEMAHVLYNHSGKCKNIHGHSYELHVCLTGDVKNHPGAPDDGMIIDFKVLKTLVKKHILNEFDHAFLVHEKASYAEKLLGIPVSMIRAVPFQPTCENLVLHFAQLLVPRLPEEVRLKHLRLYETATSYAEWTA